MRLVVWVCVLMFMWLMWYLHLIHFGIWKEKIVCQDQEASNTHSLQ